jgi:predicted Rdx family selenoprotein
MTACLGCGEPVTAKDPVRYPYCRTCHYTGRAAEHERAPQIEWFRAQLPDAVSVGVAHTGGGCFVLSVNYPDVYYWASTNDAGLPTDGPPDYTPTNGGWEVVWRYPNDEAHPDYDEGEQVSDDDGPPLTDAELVQVISGHYNYARTR